MNGHGLDRRNNALRLVIPLVIAAASMTVLHAEDYHGREAWALQNGKTKVLVTPGGGHIASMTLLAGRGSGVNPFWLPPWKSVEPGAWENSGGLYGDRPAAQLLSCILGHNICVDFFGAPTKTEADAGIPVHGEAPCVKWTSSRVSAREIDYSARLPQAQMTVRRVVTLHPSSSFLRIAESLTNDGPFDRPIGWQQHPTFGPPFLEVGATYFDMPAGWSVVYPKEFSTGERLKRGAEFTWPNAPTKSGGSVNLREWPVAGNASSDYTASLIREGVANAWFTAINTKQGLLVGYTWPRKDWPWVGNWEENRFRDGKPWLKKGLARGMEFGTTPFPDSRRDAVELGKLHNTPTYRWIGAKERQTITYAAFMAPIPAGTTGVRDIQHRGSNLAITLEGVNQTIEISGL